MENTEVDDVEEGEIEEEKKGESPWDDSLLVRAFNTSGKEKFDKEAFFKPKNGNGNKRKAPEPSSETTVHQGEQEQDYQWNGYTQQADYSSYYQASYPPSWMPPPPPWMFHPPSHCTHCTSTTSSSKETKVPRNKSIPIPEPPPLPASILEDKALSQLLISWYNTGYYTGYYQGLSDK